MLRLIGLKKKVGGITYDLNTSHVKVNPVILLAISLAILHLNTSHVKVNPHFAVFLLTLSNNLNTSHVKVNPIPNLS